MNRFRIILASVVVLIAPLTAHTALAQSESVQPEQSLPEWPSFALLEAPEEPDAIPLYGADNPGSPETESWMQIGGTVSVRNVTYPTLTPFLPDPDTANGTAVIVAPGGAFMMLSMSHEGEQVARALADQGIAAFVLKYRLVPTPADLRELGGFMSRTMAAELGDPMNGTLLSQSHAPDDARAAVALVRANAERWHIDSDRVGMIGFSAGAMTSRRAALDSPPETRPDFIGYIYGPQDGEPVPADAPPMFSAIAADDELFPTNGFAIFENWRAAGVPAELHVYEKGRHGFGLGVEGTTTSLLFSQFMGWLEMHSLLGEQQ